MRSVSKFFLPLLLAPAFLTGTAHARSCLANDLASCNLIDGNVRFSDFSFSGGFTPTANDSFSLLGFGDASGSLAFNLVPGGRNAVNASFTYTVTLLPSPLFVHTFVDANVGANGDIASGVTIASNLSATGLSTTSFTKTGNDTTAVKGTFIPNLTARTFTQTFSIDPAGNNDARLFTVSNDWSTKSSPVPGPLPLLGAATAFGLSRKLRSRIRSAA
jgi:hypothetical protein